MPKISFSHQWNASWDNHRSSIDADQIESLIGNIKELRGMKGDPTEDMHEHFKTLSKALIEKDSLIEVVKGIHYAKGITHFTISLIIGLNDAITYHVYLDIGATRARDPQIMTVVDMYDYKPVGLSTQNGKDQPQKYPPAFTALAENDHRNRTGRSVSFSERHKEKYVSVGNSSAEIKKEAQKIIDSEFPSLSS